MSQSLKTPYFSVSSEQLINTPSKKDGVDEDTEMGLRIFGCELIQIGGILLKQY